MYLVTARGTLGNCQVISPARRIPDAAPSVRKGSMGASEERPSQKFSKGVAMMFPSQTGEEFPLRVLHALARHQEVFAMSISSRRVFLGELAAAGLLPVLLAKPETAEALAAA